MWPQVWRWVREDSSPHSGILEDDQEAGLETTVRAGQRLLGWFVLFVKTKQLTLNWRLSSSPSLTPTAGWRWGPSGWARRGTSSGPVSPPSSVTWSRTRTRSTPPTSTQPSRRLPRSSAYQARGSVRVKQPSFYVEFYHLLSWWCHGVSKTGKIKVEIFPCLSF